MNTKITVSIETEVACGHMHKSIFHMEDANINVRMEAQYPKLEAAKDFLALPNIEQERSLELHGSFGKMELHMCECLSGLKRPNFIKKIYHRFMNWAYPNDH